MPHIQIQLQNRNQTNYIKCCQRKKIEKAEIEKTCKNYLDNWKRWRENRYRGRRKTWRMAGAKRLTTKLIVDRMEKLLIGGKRDRGSSALGTGCELWAASCTEANALLMALPENFLGNPLLSPRFCGVYELHQDLILCFSACHCIHNRPQNNLQRN